MLRLFACCNHSMKNSLGLVGLLITLLLVGWLIKKQLSPVSPRAVSPTSAEISIPSIAPGVSPQQQSDQIQQQVKQSVEASLQQARPAQEEK